MCVWVSFVWQVVHIDLGIAFEQGLFLQTPERVPFRLTPNIVDGMGAAGVEGPFRRCCETALQVNLSSTSSSAACWPSSNSSPITRSGCVEGLSSWYVAVCCITAALSDHTR